jgi:hypothetical protein
MAGGSVGVSFLCAFLDPATPTPLLDFSSIAGHEISGAATGVSLAASFSVFIGVVGSATPLRRIRERFVLSTVPPKATATQLLIVASVESSRRGVRV